MRDEFYETWTTKGKNEPRVKSIEVTDNTMFEYEVGMSVDGQPTRMRFLNEHLKKYGVEVDPINYALDFTQSQYPSANITFNYIKEYDYARSK
tara:strand:- start:793 stop:1071 length:279 start_codon:yes stop_codon:yes gene_type:complete